MEENWEKFLQKTDEKDSQMKQAPIQMDEILEDYDYLNQQRHPSPIQDLFQPEDSHFHQPILQHNNFLANLADEGSHELFFDLSSNNIVGQNQPSEALQQPYYPTQAQNSKNNTKGRKYKTTKDFKTSNQAKLITKNFAKTLGNHLYNFLSSQKNQQPLSNNERIKAFFAIKRGDYNRDTFNNLIKDPIAKQILTIYLENIFFTDIALGSKKEEPWAIIPCIRAYLKGIENGSIINQMD